MADTTRKSSRGDIPKPETKVSHQKERERESGEGKIVSRRRDGDTEGESESASGIKRARIEWRVESGERSFGKKQRRKKSRPAE